MTQSVQIDPQKVIRNLASRIAELEIELAMQRAANEALTEQAPTEPQES